MPELTLLLDKTTGTLLAETGEHLREEIQDALTCLLGPSQIIACSAPHRMLPPPLAGPEEVAVSPCVRVVGYWHGSIIEGPGRRSVVKLAGCPLRCRNCISAKTWDPTSGVLVQVGRLAETLLDGRYQRDGVTVLGGEPMAQPQGLLALVRALRERDCPHLLVYSGYTYEALRRLAKQEPAVDAVLAEIDLLIDGPYVEARANRAGPWTGSANQRVIDLAATRRRGRLVLATTARSSGR